MGKNFGKRCYGCAVGGVMNSGCPTLSCVDTLLLCSSSTLPVVTLTDPLTGSTSDCSGVCVDTGLSSSLTTLTCTSR